MRRTILLCTLVLFQAVALSQSEKKFNYYAYVGTNISIPFKKQIKPSPEFPGSPYTDYSSSIGYNAELLFSYKITSNVSLNSGVGYVSSRLKILDKIALEESTGHITTSYIQFPLLIKYKFTNNLPLAVSTGAYIGVLASAREKGEYFFDVTKLKPAEPGDPLLDSIIQAGPIVEKYNSNIKKDYYNYDAGLLFHVEYRFMDLEFFNLSVFSRFNLGLKNVLTNKLYNRSIAREWKNYGLQIGFGIEL